MEFSQKIVNWYLQHKRDLPWRNTSDPYKIWLSEIILQQTRVEQGLPYYENFLKEFPEVKILASADEDRVLKLWQGLGYYSRARNLHAAAKQIVESGAFPSDFNSIKKLKGVGDYTAAAISSFAFGLPHAVVDGNVYRVLARYFGIETCIASGKGKKEFQELANELLDRKKPGIHNQAIMEFGAIQCKPVSPNCKECPLSDSCIAFNSNKVNLLPVKTKTIKVRTRHFNYLVLTTGEDVLVKKRGPKDIWENLYDFPLIESENHLTFEELKETEDFKKYVLGKGIIKSISSAKHQLTHQTIMAQFIVIQISALPKLDNPFLQIPIRDFGKLSVPKLIANFIEENNSIKKILELTDAFQV